TFMARFLRRALAWAGVSRARPAPAHRRLRGDPLRRNVTRTRTAPPPRGRTAAEPTARTAGHSGRRETRRATDRLRDRTSFASMTGSTRPRAAAAERSPP